MRTQEMEAYRLEYDCSVKYEEHQQKQETSMQSSELTTNISKNIHTPCNKFSFWKCKNTVSLVCAKI